MIRIGLLQLQSNLFLSPLAGYTNLPFRLVLRELGGLGLATTDLVNARSLLERRPKALKLIETRPPDRPLAVQLFGAVPEEMRQARWMIKERQEFVSKTRREADELLEAARVQAERMVQRTEVVRAAETRARQISEAADADSRRLRHETEDFLDQRLGSFEILLDKLTDRAGGRSRRPSRTRSRQRGGQATIRQRASSTRTGGAVGHPLRINTVDLLRRPGTGASSTPPSRSSGSVCRRTLDLDAPVSVHLRLESSPTASSSVAGLRAPWTGICPSLCHPDRWWWS
jgi:hypothetical protein